MKPIFCILTFSVALTMAPLPAAAADTLYDDLGGQAGLTRITEGMLERSLKDPRIADTFENSDIDRLEGLLIEHLCDLTDGPCEFTGQSMADSHRGLHLETSDFNALVENLQEAMDDEGIDFRTQNRLLAILAPMHRDIVTR